MASEPCAVAGPGAAGASASAAVVIGAFSLVGLRLGMDPERGALFVTGLSTKFIQCRLSFLILYKNLTFGIGVLGF